MPQPELEPIFTCARANVLGVGVHALTMSEALQFIASALLGEIKGYVCVTGVHGIMEAQRDPLFKDILNHSFLTTPDGMPTVWVGHWQGFLRMQRVYGPDLMLEVCRLSLQHGYTHFLYGGRPGVAARLQVLLQQRFPGVRILGTYTPPFRFLDATEEHDLLQTVSALKPDCFWVGLSTPKQERFMADFVGRLETRLMFGVGAAFDINAGLIQDSPDWLKKAGLQWAHRLAQEPGRLVSRYLVNNPSFVLRIVPQLLGLRKYLSPPQFCLGIRNGRPARRTSATPHLAPHSVPSSHEAPADQAI